MCRFDDSGDSLHTTVTCLTSLVNVQSPSQYRPLLGLTRYVTCELSRIFRKFGGAHSHHMYVWGHHEYCWHRLSTAEQCGMDRCPMLSDGGLLWYWWCGMGDVGMAMSMCDVNGSLSSVFVVFVVFVILGNVRCLIFSFWIYNNRVRNGSIIKLKDRVEVKFFLMKTSFECVELGLAYSSTWFRWKWYCISIDHCQTK